MTFSYIPLASSPQGKLGNASFKAGYIQGSAGMEERRKGKGEEEEFRKENSVDHGMKFST